MYWRSWKTVGCKVTNAALKQFCGRVPIGDGVNDGVEPACSKRGYPKKPSHPPRGMTKLKNKFGRGIYTTSGLATIIMTQRSVDVFCKG
tara:strand:+ start:127 stop:393 length:267 start_codon:yes stop_codon:yes gene_type:complete